MATPEERLQARMAALGGGDEDPLARLDRRMKALAGTSFTLPPTVVTKPVPDFPSNAVLVPPDPTVRGPSGGPVAMRITADAPTPFTATAAHLQNPTTADLATPDPRLSPSRGIADVYGSDVVRGLARGLAESGYGVAQGTTNLVAGKESDAAKKIRDARSWMRAYYGDPETGVGVGANIAGTLGGTAATFAIPGMGLGKLAELTEGMEGLGAVRSALQLAKAPGMAGAATRLGVNAATMAPIDVALSQSPEDAAATGIGSLARMTGHPDAAARLEAIGQDPKQSAFFQLAAGILPGAAFEGAAAAPAAVRAVRDFRMPDFSEGMMTSAAQDLSRASRGTVPTDPREGYQRLWDVILNERDRGETTDDFWNREVPPQKLLTGQTDVESGPQGPAIPLGRPTTGEGGSILQPAVPEHPLLQSDNAAAEALRAARGTSGPARAAATELAQNPQAQQAALGAVAGGAAPDEDDHRLRNALLGAGVMATPASARRTVAEVAELLAKEAPEDLKSAGYGASIAAAVRRGLPDVIEALSKMPHAAEWYRTSLDRMNTAVREMLPSTEDPGKLAVFHGILAVTSNGNNPLANFKAAAALYTKWERAGYNFNELSMLTGPAQWSGGKWVGAARDPQIPGHVHWNTWELHLKKLQEYLEPIAPDDWQYAMDALVNERKQIPHTYAATGERVLLDSPASVEMFGPKVGRFYANIRGSAQDVTVDKWAHRTLGSWLGYSPFDAAGEQGAPSDFEGNVMRLAVQELSQGSATTTGQHFDPMDIQALLWYYEKQRYADLGARDSGQFGYDDAARALADQRAAATAGHAGLGALSAGAAPEKRDAAAGGEAQGNRAAVGRPRPASRAPQGQVLYSNPIGPALAQAQQTLAAAPAAAGRLTRRLLQLSQLSPDVVARSDEHFNFAKVALDPSGEATLRDQVSRVTQQEGLDPKTPVTHAQTVAEAKQLGMSPEALMQAAQRNRLSGAQMVALRQVIADNTNSLTQRLKALEQPNLPTPKRLQLEQEADAIEKQTDALVAKYSTQRSTTGRDLNSLKIVANISLDPALWLTKARKALGEAPLTQEHITKINGFINANDRAGLAQYVAGLASSPTSNQVLSIWKTGMLTNPTTHIKKFSSEAALAAGETAKDVPAAMMDAFLSGITGQSSKDVNVLETVKASIDGAKQGLRDAKATLQGRPVQTAMKQWDLTADPNTIDFLPWPTGNKVLTAYVKTVHGALEGGMRFWQGVALKRSLAEQSRVIAKNEGLVGAKAVARAKQLYMAPTNEMALSAMRDAEIATFQDPNPISQAAKGLRRPLGTAGHVVLPFAQVPGAVAMRAIEYSPAGFLLSAKSVAELLATAAKKANTPEAARQILTLQKLASDRFGRAAVGLLPIAAGYVLAHAGVMDRGRSNVAAERDAREVEGRTDSGIDIGGVSRSPESITPLGNLMAVGAALHFAQENPEMSTPEILAAAEAVVGKSVVDESFLKGVDDLRSVVQDPEEAAGRYMQGLAGSVVPAVLASAARSMDPVVRQPSSMGQAIQARIPGLSKNVPSKLDALGDEIPSEGGIAPFVDITRPRLDRTVDDPVRAALRAADANIARLKKQKGESAEDFRARQIETGREIKEDIADEVSGTDLSQLSPEDLKDLRKRLESIVRREKSTESRRARRDRLDAQEQP